MAKNRRTTDLLKGILRRRDEYLENIGEPLAGRFGDFTAKGEARKLADAIVSGRVPFRFFDVKLMQVGRRDIDWSGKHLAHQEWPAQLNRFFHLAPLSTAWMAARKACYAEAARDYVEDWLRAHPLLPAWTLSDGDNTLTLSIRQQMWWTNLPSFFDHPAFDEAFVERLAESTACQVGFLKDNLNWEGNWRIAHAESILVCGLILAHRPEAEAWRTLGVGVLNDAFHRQVLPDGAHIERNCGYHAWMTTVFERYWKLGRRMPGLGLAMTPDVIARMHDYSIANQRPNGSSSGLHDSTGVNAGPRGAGWDRSYLSFRKAAGLPETHPPVRQVFPDAGQAFLRSAWDEKAVWLSFDATRWGGGHCHLSRNAVQLFAGGRALVVDPGILNYDARDPMMFYGRSTRSHSTVNLNGWNQGITNPGRLQYSSAPGYACVGSVYDGGYWPGRYQWYFDQGSGSGIWAEHYRLLLWICGRAIVIIDAVKRNAEPAAPFLESNWQLAPGKVELDAAAGLAWTGHDDSNVLMLFPVRPAGSTLSVHEGENDPPLGWLPNRTPAPLVSLRNAPMQDCLEDMATVLVPFAGTEPPGVEALGKAPGQGGTGELALTWKDGSRDLVWWTHKCARMLGRGAQWNTDAGLLSVSFDPAGRPRRAFALDATYLEPFTTDRRTRPESFSVDMGTGKQRRQARLRRKA